MPQSCKGIGYCFEKSNVYPQELVDSLLNVKLTLGKNETSENWRQGTNTHDMEIAEIIFNDQDCEEKYYVVVCGTHLTHGAVTKKNDYIPIKYPGPIQELTFNRYGTSNDEVPEECKNKNYCSVKPPDYPQERFNKMFKGTKAVKQPTLVVDDLADAPNRQGDPDEVDNCESTVEYQPLFKVRSSRGWHVVVQAPDENYVQMVRLETCDNLGGSCFTAFPSLPDLKTSCKQKYSTWEFLVADDKNGTERVKTDLPICCSCHYKYVF